MAVRAGDAATAGRGRSATGARDVALALGRIAVGAYWLYEQHWKLPPDFGLHQPRGLLFAFEQGIEHPTLGVYATFLRDVVVPHFHLFGWLLFAGEVTIGTSLALGVFTKAGAALGTLQAANLLVAMASTPEGPWIYVAILAANVAALATPCNRRLSLDRLLATRLGAAAARGNTLARVARALAS